MTAVDALAALTARTADLGLPPPAALIGDWLGADAVIAPSIDLRAGVAPPDRPESYWFGALGFPAHSPGAARPVFPTVVGGFTDGVLVLADGEWSWRSPTGAPRPSWTDDCLTGPAAGASVPWTATWRPPAREPHLDAVRSCLEAIGAGEVYQACVCTRFTGELDGDPLRFFTDVAAATAPAKAAWLTGAWGSVASFSPESFLSRVGDDVTSSPIKGTVPADADPSTLAGSVKDVAENVMIVDLVRNDLGRVAAIGGVDVRDLLSVVPAPGVWHLVSTVGAHLRDDVGNDALLAAAFPPASVTGTPKLRALDLLADWEPTDRGVYCGAVGVAGPDGLLDLSVAIRTVQIDPAGGLILGVGGGITADSDPEAEWRECLDKAASIVSRTAG